MNRPESNINTRELLPSADEVAGKVICSQVSICHSVQREGGGAHVTITHDVLDITIQGPLPSAGLQLPPPHLPVNADVQCE